MSTITAVMRPIPMPRRRVAAHRPADQAFLLLRIGFAVAPILFGIDKFAEVMNDNWAAYLAPEYNDLIPGSAADAMHMVGDRGDSRRVRRPRLAPLRRPAGRRVAGGIIGSLLLVGGYGDIVLRDFGLLIAAPGSEPRGDRLRRAGGLRLTRGRAER